MAAVPNDAQKDSALLKKRVLARNWFAFSRGTARMTMVVGYMVGAWMLEMRP